MSELQDTMSTIFPDQPVLYSLEFLLSIRDIPYSKEKPSDLPDFIDRDKTTSETGVNRGIRKQRRQGPIEGDASESLNPSEGWQRNSQPSIRRENNGWQPVNHQEHEEQFHNRVPNAKSSVSRPPTVGDQPSRIIPGKGAPRRPIDQQMWQSAKVAPQSKWDHQPALANVVTKQQQGMTGIASGGQVAKGLDAFSMGDIRQAEKFLESGRMGLDEYARKVAAGEISRLAQPEHAHPVSGGFFADEDDPNASRPWLGSSLTGNLSTNRIVPGSMGNRSVPSPPPPVPTMQTHQAAQQQGKDSNASGLALLQMLIDRKTSPATSKQPQGPRQLTQQQINELIAMSKKAGPKNATPSAGANPNRLGTQSLNQNPPKRPQPNLVPGTQPRHQIIPGQQSRTVQQPSSGPVTHQTPPHVAALLEQLHRQQLAQQQTTGQPPAGNAQPQECQQQ